MVGILQRIRNWYFTPDDEQHIERVRKSLARLDRHRQFLAGLYGLLLCFWFGLAVAMTILMQRIGSFLIAGEYWGPTGFLIGMMLGIPYGFAVVHNTHGFLNALVSMRNERLMLRYHDELAELRRPGITAFSPRSH
jgi:hypothetical protein